MITPLLKSALEPVIARHRLLRYLRTLALWLAGAALLSVGLYEMRDRFTFPAVLIFVALFVVGRIIGRRVNQWEPDFGDIARDIEQQHPELHALLLTAVEQRPDPQSGQLGFLQKRVVQEVLAESRKAHWIDAVPAWRLWSWGSAVAVLLAVVAVISYQTGVAKKSGAKLAAAKTDEPVTVTPGDAAIERGAGLVVLATFHRDVPSEAVLILQPKNQPEQRLPLVKNMDDPVFGGGLPEVEADLRYRVEYAGKATRDFAVKVFEHPRLDRADATLHFPKYTQLADKQIPDTRRVSAVEGTKLDVAFQLNKPVKSATLVAKDGTTVPLAIQPGHSIAELRALAVLTSQTYELKLEDAEGRASKVPAQFVVEALPNRRPELKFLTPKGDQRVTPLQEVAFQAEAWDDFGLSRYGLTVNVAGRGEKELELGQTTRADERRAITHLLKLEDVAVKPDELVSWFLWAEDTGPDGQPRRTVTDIFFAEVRPFEEIYKPGDAGAGSGSGKGGAGEQATKLAALQKQVISATWNLQRAEDANAGPKKPGEKYLKDEPVVRDGQAEAIGKVDELLGQIENAKSRAFAENAKREMQSALSHLTKAALVPAPLPDALAAEQLAYNALLKLAAHEFQVTKSKGKGESNGQQQAQLDELEMKAEEKRYETKSEAQPAQNEQQREQLAILNRLKELAQRQNDINEKVKELQTALQAAPTEKEKEEIRRQLKRLREEEQQLLADLDETRQKMEQSPQQAQLADERQKLEQTRSEAQKAAEALEKGQTSQALASGTRTQRDLQQMRDDFRKKTSGQFTDEMRQMRADARDLAQHQQELADKLKPAAGKAERRTLDGSSEREQLAEKFTRQQGDLGQITEAMKRVSEQAEAAEPLLAKELYDTLRQTTQAGTGETLEKTQQLAKSGNGPLAQKFEEKARQEIEDLKSGVERAAESVLGNEAEALRLARAELDTLTQQLNRELAQARPDLAAATPASFPEGQTPAASESAPGQPPGSTPVPGVGEGVPPSRTSGDAPNPGASAGATSPEVRLGETPGSTPGTGVLPGKPADAASQSPGENPPAAEPGGQSGKGGQPGVQPSQSGQGGKTPGDSKSQPGKGEGQGQGQAQTEAQGKGQGQGQGQGKEQGEGPGRGAGGKGAGGGAEPGGKESSGQPSSKPAGQRPGSTASGTAEAPRQRGGIRSGGDGGGTAGGGTDGEQAGPLTGDKFTEWSDRLRNVEEMIDAPELRTEAARIRELAKGVRVEFKRHSVNPNWEMVKTKIGTPLAELRNRLTEELARRESKDSLVPIDRDPVPAKYAERVRRYYEDLGRSR